MAYFSDLSPYRYDDNHQEGVVHIGWLGEGQPFSEGIVATHLVAKLKILAQSPVELYRGFHICEVCSPPNELRPYSIDPADGEAWWQWAEPRSSNGEIRIAGDSIIYAAPVLITHYIEAHNYLPPTEFLNALEKHRME